MVRNMTAYMTKIHVPEKKKYGWEFQLSIDY